MAIRKNLNNQRIEYVSQDGSVHDVSTLFQPIWHHYSLNEGELIDCVEFERYENGSRKTFKIDTINLASSATMRNELYKHHVYYREFYNPWISEYITDQIDVLANTGKVSFKTNKLGWQQVEWLTEPEFILGSKFYPNVGHIDYYDSKLKFLNGSKANQVDFIKNEILPYTETRFALTLGLASIVASYIEPFKSIGTLVVNVSGMSSTGKSTIAELSASMFADPKTSNHGIVRTFNATKNFILGMSEGRNGLPIILDDANANANEHSKADLIYQFALGESRGRCNSNGDVQSTRNGWSGLVIITSESPLLARENMSQGAQVRTLSIEDIIWTQNAEHSDRIKIGVRNDFGHIAPDIAQCVKALGTDKLLLKHDDYTKLILEKMVKKDHFSSRMASKLAPIAICAEILNNYFGANSIDINEIIDFLVVAEQKSITKTSLQDRAYDALENFVTINRSKFSIIRYMGKYKVNNSEEEVVDFSFSHGTNFGNIFIRKQNSEVYIAKEVFEKFMKDNGFFETTTIMRAWEKENKTFRGSADRFVFRPSASAKMSCSYYKFRMESLNEMIVSSHGLMIDPTLKEDKSGLTQKDKEMIEKDNKLKLGSKVEDSTQETPMCNYSVEMSDEEIDEIFKEQGE